MVAAMKDWFGVELPHTHATYSVEYVAALVNRLVAEERARCVALCDLIAQDYAAVNAGGGRDVASYCARAIERQP